MRVYRYLDVVSDNRDVLEVESGVDLVHDVDRGSAEFVQGKDQ